MPKGYKFDRMEFAGSLGDLGTLLPIAIAMVLFNGLSPLGVFFSIGIFYVLSGVYFGVTVPVQPMKVIGAYAIATSMSPDQILSSSLLMGVFLLIIGMTGTIDFIQKFTPKAVIRGVQLSTGVLLISGGIKFIIGTSRFQLLQNAVEPYLAYQYVGPLPLSLIIGIISGIITLMLLDSKKFPAGLIIISGGLITGILLGKVDSGNLHMALNLPELFPFGFPDKTDFSFALFALVLPQLPMTLGNAVMAYTDLSKKYFGILSTRVTNQKVCVSMGLANIFSFCLGGMPMCHGAGGLAAHYRFGARTGGSNLMIGFIFIVLAMLLGDNIVQALNLLPMSILGVLLIFAGSQLTLTIMDLSSRKEYYIATLILGITLASNLASGFIAGMLVGHLLRWDKLSV